MRSRLLIVANLLLALQLDGFGTLTQRPARSVLSMAIAPFKKARRQNVPGNLYVDESCIDCDVCRWMSPSTFSRIGIKSAVYAQPEGESQKLQAYAAMVACPVGSIRTHAPDPLIKAAFEAFPAEIDPERMPGVQHLGFHSAESFGATPYFLQRPNNAVGGAAGNVMIDTPRFNSRLADALEAAGGVQMLVLTHKDDVADHDKWKARFPQMQRVIHRTDMTADTAGCEVQLEGLGPWDPAPDLRILHTPGHTAGSVCALYNPNGSGSAASGPLGEAALFSGDHLAYSAGRKALTGFRRFNKGNVEVQADSIRMLADEDVQFCWLLPGHGRMLRFRSMEEKGLAVAKAAEAFMADDDAQGTLSLGYD